MKLHPAKDGHGWEPGFPEGVGFLLLADCRPAKWGLYEFYRNEDAEDWQPESPVSGELEVLLESSKKFPPALALARDRVSDKFSGREPTQEEFIAVLANSLQYHLSRQAMFNYFLAPALNDELGYLCKGEWYWVLGKSQSDTEKVRWVSTDFFVYCNPIADFDLTEPQLQNLNKDNEV